MESKNKRRWGLMLAAIAFGSAASGQTVSTPGGYVPEQAMAFGTRGTPAVAVDAANPLPVAPQMTAASYVDRSGSVATAGAAQSVAPARAGRHGFFLQNLSSGDLWIGFGSAATIGAPSLRLAAGQLYESPASGIPADAISVTGATAGQSFTAKEW